MFWHIMDFLCYESEYMYQKLKAMALNFCFAMHDISKYVYVNRE